MQLEGYDLQRGKRHTVFHFESVGVKGTILKTIQFQLIQENFYNLAFGDSATVEAELDDLVVTNNGDTSKVLATVAYAVYLFTSEQPFAWIFAKGSTSSRTRLYRMGISSYFKEIADEFEILGEISEDWEAFQGRKEYTAFAVRRKSINLSNENGY